MDQFHPCIQDLIENTVHIEVDGNCGYHVIVALFAMGENSWSLVHNHLLKEHGQWYDEYIDMLGSIDIYDQLKQSLRVDELSMVYKFFVRYSWINIFLIVLIKIVTCR